MFDKNVGLLLTLHLLLLRFANGEGICTKLKYGIPEDDYMPVLVKYCCPGYGGVNSNQCLPRCDMGCPPNSYCVIPNVCDCKAGYEIDETYLYYGLKAIKSCRSKNSASAIISIAVSGLSVIVIVVALVALLKYLRKRHKEPDQKQGGSQRHTMV